MTSGSVVGVLGTGLIGGSIGLRVRAEGARTIGYDSDRRALDAATNAGALDEAVTREELYARAETVVIAVHLDAAVREIAQLRERAPVRAGLIIDVSSVKVPICAAAGTLARFVATHPMAGSERSGAAAARPALFEGRSWAYVPSGDPSLDMMARGFIASLGAQPFAIAAEEHDRVVAFTSHLPQLIAWVYARQARHHTGSALEALTGAPARELLRVGASEDTMWRDILRANRANVTREFDAFNRALEDALELLRVDELPADHLDSRAGIQPCGSVRLTQERPPDILP